MSNVPDAGKMSLNWINQGPMHNFLIFFTCNAAINQQDQEGTIFQFL